MSKNLFDGDSVRLEAMSHLLRWTQFDEHVMMRPG